MNQRFKVDPKDGHLSIFQPGEKGIKWLGLEVLRLDPGEEWKGEFKSEEAALVVLSGKCSIIVEAKTKTQYDGVGGRGDMFAGSPYAVYAPRESKVAVKAQSKLELAIAKAPCDVDLEPTLIQPDQVKVLSSGMANWRRDVRLVIPPGSPTSQRLIVGETYNPPGNWSGIPPHKHDEKTEAENFLEEFYLFKTKPADSYGVQLMYKGGEGQGHIIGNNDVTVMLSGYHPTVASPGTGICYLWVLSGDSKAYDISIDPRFSWVGTAELVLKEEQQG